MPENPQWPPQYPSDYFPGEDSEYWDRALETMPPSFLSALIVGYLVTIKWPDPELEAEYRKDLASLEAEDSEPGVTATAPVAGA